MHTSDLRRSSEVVVPERDQMMLMFRAFRVTITKKRESNGLEMEFGKTLARMVTFTNKIGISVKL